MANTTTNQANGATKGQPQPAKARGTQAAASSMPRKRCPHRPGLPATGRHQATLGAARGSPPSGALRRPCCSKAVKKEKVPASRAALSLVPCRRALRARRRERAASERASVRQRQSGQRQAAASLSGQAAAPKQHHHHRSSSKQAWQLSARKQAKQASRGPAGETR